MRNILFITSNGFGLGHVTRCMAIAKRLPPDIQPVIFTLSEALPVVRQQGFFAEYFASRDTETADQWNGRLRKRLLNVFKEYDPDVVIFDGTHSYRGMRDAIEEDDNRKFVWSRRGMWRPGGGVSNLTFASYFDAIIEPGEFAHEADQGLTTQHREGVTMVDPILFCDEEDLLSREDAERELGLEPGAVNVLIQPGWENDEYTPTGTKFVERLRREGEPVQIVVATSPLKSRDVPLPEGLQRVSTYPLARVYRAFDLCVSGAGYNIFHELVGYQVPALFIPNAGTPLDDQVARTQYAQEKGVARSWEDGSGESLEKHLALLLDPAERERMRSRMLELRFPNGAKAAADRIAELSAERQAEQTAAANA
ncbi:MAG: UDP-N-acetylglucosamine--N-acetylmuramyl-(pentapeptide) pyrophosphoryl-undecaprenol [Thermoleophilaceae bacterium]|nr:UDP-N-acetylglucosamine--N-acetylmuramyl-(pentapeptide) pyrophosphoryl-undecaprenol [Thermoleophilaceae bacterium]